MEDKKSKDDEERGTDIFYNKEKNFSISWFSSLAEYHNSYMMDRMRILEKLTDKGKNVDVE